MAERMKLVSLFSTENGADKQYTVWIEPHGAGFVVQAQWGPRGGTVQSGAKTGPTPVSMEKAEAVYAKTVKEKIAKGYHAGEDAPAFSQVDGAKDSGLRPMLLTDATEVGPEPYILSDDWAAQQKMNGKRIIIRADHGKVTGVNRRGLECPIPKVVADYFKTWEDVFTFDGELIGDVYYAFDALEKHTDLRGLSMETRFKSLVAVIGRAGPVRYVPLIFGKEGKRALVVELRDGRREGVVFKNIHAVYEPGRVERLALSSAVKVKFYKEASLLILGWTDKSSIRVAARDFQPNGDKQHVFVGNVTVPEKHVVQINGALAGKSAAIVRVRYLYATANRILYQPNLDPDSAGRVIRDDVAEADQLLSLKLEGKGEEE
jgi:bifunctional non-homologous end joining protein LigD